MEMCILCGIPTPIECLSAGDIICLKSVYFEPSVIPRIEVQPANVEVSTDNKDDLETFIEAHGAEKDKNNISNQSVVDELNGSNEVDWT